MLKLLSLNEQENLNGIRLAFLRVWICSDPKQTNILLFTDHSELLNGSVVCLFIYIQYTSN